MLLQYQEISMRKKNNFCTATKRILAAEMALFISFFEKWEKPPEEQKNPQTLKP